MSRLHELCRLNTSSVPDHPPRGAARQRPRRQLENAVRRQVVHFSQLTVAQGLSVTETARLLDLDARTVYYWRACHGRRRLHACVLGRPLVRASAADRNQVIELLDELGLATGLPTLQDCFPDLCRAELEDVLKRYRRLWRMLHARAVYHLRWPVPGRVWAIDFTEAPQPIDGLYPYLLAVRDLASGAQLLWQPVTDLGAATACAALTSLFAVAGAPLVLKMDNGSAFLAEHTRELLEQFGVMSLFSPPYTPRYNGAIEAGIGSLKSRTEAQATHQGHPGSWTWQDAEAARHQANATARPQGPRAPTAEALWQARRPITAEEHALFQAAVQRRRTEADQQTECCPTVLTPAELRSRDRHAIRRALVEHGYLLFRRR